LHKIQNEQFLTFWQLFFTPKNRHFEIKSTLNTCNARELKGAILRFLLDISATQNNKLFKKYIKFFLTKMTVFFWQSMET
jgi:hypothetical protein